MPKLSVWMVRASLVHMGTGFLFGSVILAHKGITLFDWTWQLLNPHIELMIFGWTMQLVMGVAFHILPRSSAWDNRYGREYLGWWSFYLLNAGIILNVVAYWLAIPPLIMTGRILTLLAVITFTVMIWPRVKPFAHA